MAPITKQLIHDIRSIWIAKALIWSVFATVSARMTQRGLKQRQPGQEDVVYAGVAQEKYLSTQWPHPETIYEYNFPAVGEKQGFSGRHYISPKNKFNIILATSKSISMTVP